MKTFSIFCRFKLKIQNRKFCFAFVHPVSFVYLSNPPWRFMQTADQIKRQKKNCNASGVYFKTNYLVISFLNF